MEMGIGHCAALWAASHCYCSNVISLTELLPSRNAPHERTRRKHMNSVKSWKTILAACAAIMAASAYGAAAQGQGGWVVYGGDHANTRYSPLKQINTGNVQDLKVAWVLQLGSLEAQESTPIVIG